MAKPREIIRGEDGKVKWGSQRLRVKFSGEDVPLCVICSEVAKLRVKRKTDGVEFYSDTCSNKDCISKYKTQIVHKLRKEKKIRPFGYLFGKSSF